MASEASNLNEFKRQLDIFISGEKGLKETEINQGVRMKYTERKGLMNQRILSLVSNSYIDKFNMKSCCVKRYFYIVSPCLKKKHFVSEDEFY